jgi:hypothetical protein
MPGKWQNVSAGPRQIKDLDKAMRDLTREGQTHDELTGVIGGEEHRATLWSPFGAVRPDVTERDEPIRARYGCQVTRDNVRAIIADYEAATAEAAKSRPVTDDRRTPEEDAEGKARAAARAAADQAERDAQQAILDKVMAKAPRGARALIVAEYHVDASDPHADYFSSRTVRSVAIGFRLSPREDFRALRAAAGQFPETAHLASEEALSVWADANGAHVSSRGLEHRDNYSLGAGNYLSDHGTASSGTGWVVRSRAIPCQYVHLTEDAIGDQPSPPGMPGPGDGAVTVSPSSLGREGVVEIRFSKRPADNVLEGLKDHGFRWARRNRCWYGSDTAYAEALVAGDGFPAAAGARPAAETESARPAGPGEGTTQGSPPSVVQLKEWLEESGCETPDGCWVEPNGTCEHGQQSWLLQLGMI